MVKEISELSGLIVPLVTPMEETLEIDKIALKTHVSRLMNLGVKNFLLLGQTGEFEYLGLEQEVEAIRTVSGVVGSKANFLVGCFDKSAENIIEKVNLADRNGADACFVNVPLTAITNEVFFIDYFEELFNQTHTKLFLYNNPKVFKRNIPIRGIEKIANWEKLFGIKDSSGNYEYFKEICNFKQSMKIFQGDESLAFNSLRLNCSGLVAGTANIYPSLFLDIIREFRKLNLQGMVRQQHLINSMLEEYIPRGKNVQAYKYVLSLQGITQPYHSRSLTDLTQKEKLKLEEFVKVVLA